MNTDVLSEFNFLSYPSQNVFAYFVVLPLLWCATIDYKWIHRPWTTLTVAALLLCAVLLAGGWHLFTAELYNAGIGFCAYWRRFGYSYAEACIVWCVIWPMVITIALVLIPARKGIARLA